jgi:SAM-dependent methyltransferase
MQETERIKKAYKKRDLSNKRILYSFFNKASLFIKQQRDMKILDSLSRISISNLSDKIILDLGCGSGGVLRDFINYGVNPQNLFGFDLLADRIAKAKRLSPNIDFKCGNAERLPYKNSFFDLVLCFTVFTSIFDKTMKQNIAKEMIRTLKPKGSILWYDYHMDNPKNPDVKGVKKKEIYELFPNCEIYLKRITLAPPLARIIAPHSLFLCYLLEKLKLLNTHYIGLIKKV